MNEKPEFKDHKIQHYLNGGEPICHLEDVSFSPDGFLTIGNINHYFQAR